MDAVLPGKFDGRRVQSGLHDQGPSIKVREIEFKFGRTICRIKWSGHCATSYG
jgi:hypothetical protein